MAAYNRPGNRFSGIGYVFTEDDPFTGFDLDHCIVDGKIATWAEPYIDRLHTYGEISQSGSGIKFIGRAKLSGDGTRRNGFGDGSGAIEIYDRLRYFALTGWSWKEKLFAEPGFNDVEDLDQDFIEQLYAKLKTSNERPKSNQQSALRLIPLLWTIQTRPCWPTAASTAKTSRPGSIAERTSTGMIRPTIWA